MKKLVLSLMAAVALMFVPQALTAVNFVQYLATYGNSLTVGTDTLGGVTYSTVRYGDLYNGGEPGMPSLPIDYIRFSVPYNATNFTVTASPSRWSTANLSYLLYPCQMPWIPNDSIAPPIMLPDTAAYYSGVSYPSQMAWVADEGFLAGENHIVTVAVMPFRYTHSSTSDEVRKCRNLTVRLNYELSDSLAMYPIVRNDSALREEGYQLAQSMVVNPNKVKSFSYGFSNPVGPSEPGGPINPNGGLGGDGLNFAGDPGEVIFDPDTTQAHYGGDQYTNQYYPYLIVTTSDLRHATRRIAALKRQKGYNVKVVTMDEVVSDSIANVGDYVNGNLVDSTCIGMLRHFLRCHFENHGTEYVLLAGTSIPYRHITEVVKYDENQIDSIDCISDFYYSELNSDWLGDVITDHQPELYVGRILAKESNQIDNYTDKLLRYELNPGQGDYSYLRRLLTQEGSDFIGSISNFQVELDVYFPYQIPLPKDIYGKNVIDTLNILPVGLINIFNHGDTCSIMVHGSKDNDLQKSFIHSTSSVASGDGLNCMNNKYYPMIFYSLACTTVPFDNKNGINMGESFTTGKDYGGPVYIGYTRQIDAGTLQNVVWHFANRLKNRYFTLGEADALSVWDSNSNIFSKQNASPLHAYIGDPSVEIWTDEPQVYSNILVERENHSVTITGIDADSTIVAYCSNEKKSGYRMTSSSTLLLNNVSPNSTIMLYKHNHIPYIAPLELQNIVLTNSQYVIASDVTCGQFVNSNRVKGAVVVKEGVEYEIEATGTVSLQDGFIVEKGATFAVYPSCF